MVLSKVFSGRIDKSFWNSVKRKAAQLDSIAYPSVANNKVEIGISRARDHMLTLFLQKLFAADTAPHV